MSTQVEALISSAPVMPVLVIDHVEDAVPLAQALVAGGLTILEVTLRTPNALAAIRRISAEVEGVMVGAGTVTNSDQLAAVQQAGGQFAISPGATPELLQSGIDSELPYLPAISTVSELMLAMGYGYRAFKFFPAESSGGAAALKAIAGPFPDIRFCPTGGIGLGNFLDYLSLPSVDCVGGSWVAPAKLIREQNWSAITQLAAEAVHQANQHNI
ncbi:bifunctional 4-hydroxy-2-oxoglutarate aldolase/2-dehydro-3-deoxy-phosphogluconate aldolase [Aestuariirhabdus haliotis]|uniref:bifunctional 4-hydroxy-2-oxoglutarate aldolase/2-dehydro-3-deoxy-phosphogluconate aldolase n=1 Tax=Aestuariirhabdus haliotis TaxID=2918751 RepID=UPI0020BF7C32|nr:bifunctional 4-hydroxy-2-oxoglutarate aldolase/2-dehydro-3-deoxy-phosphogluconate aldolase [Aestuariirhabdus haliotis]MCL6420981.1 bifunctional 4-hydroxy-2-oxoglutarate aldolase/2-dehydro-3-deoxy-phosphogluconate aldolase [Aestuariirhabdus haliotis]